MISVIRGLFLNIIITITIVTNGAICDNVHGHDSHDCYITYEEALQKLLSRTLNSMSPQKENLHIGPSIRSTDSPMEFLITNEGAQIDHSCSTVPMTVPGGADISID
jgi:hypothetical protein